MDALSERGNKFVVSQGIITEQQKSKKRYGAFIAMYNAIFKGCFLFSGVFFQYSFTVRQGM